MIFQLTKTQLCHSDCSDFDLHIFTRSEFPLHRLSGGQAYESMLLRKEEVLGLRLHSKNRVIFMSQGGKNLFDVSFEF